MKGLLVVLVALSFFGPFGFAKGGPEESAVPLEDSCPLCGAYGYCNKQPAYKDAAAVLKSHYEKKGMQVVVTKQNGRFLEAEVYSGGRMADRVLLDLRTGRIRSMY